MEGIIQRIAGAKLLKQSELLEGEECIYEEQANV